MADVGGIPRTRGAVSGVLLILLGVWGGLIPFVGPYFRFEYSPDRAWAYTSGRLYLSVIPGAVTLLAGLVILLTRSRALGVLAGLLAVLRGAWFITGDQIAQVLLKSSTITPGTPAGTPVPLGSGAVRMSTRMFAEQVGFFTGLGIVIIFLAAIAIGRFSMLAARDAARDAAADSYPGEQHEAPGADGDQYPTAPGRYAPSADPLGQTTTSEFPAADTGQFPPPAGQFPSPSGQFRAPADPRLPGSADRFPPAAEQVSPAPAEQVSPAPAEQVPPAQDQFPASAD